MSGTPCASACASASGTGLNALRRRANAPLAPDALVAFRIAFGLLVTASAVRFLAYGWVEALFTAPKFRFHFYGLGWVPPLPHAWTAPVFAALAVLGLLVAAGAFYRLAMPLLFLLFTWVQLTDVANYLNHYVLVSLLALLLTCMPLHRAFSVDAWRNPALRTTSFPAWCTWLLRFQVGVVYVSAGLAKCNSDWLLHAQPLNLWLSARAGLPGIGPLLATREAAFVSAWFGFAFDLTVPLFLSLRRTRALAYLAVLIFHLSTWLLFPIGMFPLIMITGALVFFDPAWPRRFLPAAPAIAVAASPAAPLPRWAVAALTAFCAVQVALPLRAHLYGGDVSWHEQGMRFSWRVMTREKNGSVTFMLKNLHTGRSWQVSPRDVLTRAQERELSVQPDLILQLAQHLGAQWNREGRGPVAVYADAVASLNGRAAQPLIDPAVDLMTVRDGLGAATWVLPAPTTPPLHLRDVAAR